MGYLHLPLAPFPGGSSSREGAFPGYLALWSTRSPGIRFRLYAIASKIFCVCVHSSPRYRHLPPENHLRILPKVRSIKQRILLMALFSSRWRSVSFIPFCTLSIIPRPILVAPLTYIRVVAPRRDKSCGRAADKFGLRTWL